MDDPKSSKELLNCLLARSDLQLLDSESRILTGKIVERITGEVAKAVTVASLHGDIEARVVCDSTSDFAEAKSLLSGPNFLVHCGGTWKAKARTLELPNGSAVVVVARPTTKVHKGAL